MLKGVLAAHIVKHTDRSQVLPAPFLKEDAKGDGRLAGAANTGDDDEAILGDGEIDVL